MKDISLLGESKEVAEKRLNEIWKKLSRAFNLKSFYSEFMLGYKTLNHMELVDESESEITYYMPHHFLYSPTKSSI